jgi:hypothetical protein
MKANSVLPRLSSKQARLLLSRQPIAARWPRYLKPPNPVRSQEPHPSTLKPTCEQGPPAPTRPMPHFRSHSGKSGLQHWPRKGQVNDIKKSCLQVHRMHPPARLAAVDCLPWKLAGRFALTAASRGGDVGAASSAAAPRRPVRARAPATFALEADRPGRARRLMVCEHTFV